ARGDSGGDDRRRDRGGLVADLLDERGDGSERRVDAIVLVLGRYRQGPTPEGAPPLLVRAPHGLEGRRPHREPDPARARDRVVRPLAKGRTPLLGERARRPGDAFREPVVLLVGEREVAARLRRVGARDRAVERRELLHLVLEQVPATADLVG